MIIQTAKSVAASASMALGLIISKFYANGGMSYQVFTRVGVICNCNIKINSNLPFFNVIASNQLLSS